MRLTAKSYALGLATKERFDRTEEKRKQIEQLIEFCNSFSLKPALINDALESLGTTPLSQGIKLSDLLGRPQISFENILPHIKPLQKAIENIMPDASEERRKEIIEAAEIRIKYAGYISREQQAAEKMIRLENIKIAGKFDYPNLSQISIEARQKLQAIQPVTLGQASRIPGVSPSDINIMLVLLGR
jgi:tRNA uridine 5-carboxymethylaminomethyl modification enzyme